MMPRHPLKPVFVKNVRKKVPALLCNAPMSLTVNVVMIPHVLCHYEGDAIFFHVVSFQQFFASIVISFKVIK